MNYTYQVSDLNLYNNTTTIGIARMSKIISEEEYLQYFNVQTSITTVISNLFDSEYECTGSCYCEEEKIRRNSASIINRGVFVMISAFSVTMAIDIAKDAFQNHCEDKLAKECSKTNVKSEVDGCEKQDDHDYFENRKERIDNEEDLTRRIYSCSGYCVENKHNLFHDTDNIDKARDNKNIVEVRKAYGNCRKLELRDVQVEIVLPDIKERITTSNTEARKAFCRDYFTKFCKSQSLVKVWAIANSKTNRLETIMINGEKKVRYFKEKETPSCCANNDKLRKNVKCKLIRKEFL